MEYKLFTKDFIHIADYLTNYDYPIIYASQDNIITTDDEQTINRLVSIEMFKMKSCRKLHLLGYKKFNKDDGGIYFYRYMYLAKTTGIMYYPDGFKTEYNGLITKSEEFDNGWYYFEQR